MLLLTKYHALQISQEKMIFVDQFIT